MIDNEMTLVYKNGLISMYWIEFSSVRSVFEVGLHLDMTKESYLAAFVS